MRQFPCRWCAISGVADPPPPLLLSSPLQSLSFERCKRISDDVLQNGLPLLPNLEILSVSGTSISSAGARCIGAHCRRLRELDVSCLGRFDDGCAAATLGASAAHGGGLVVLIADKTRMTGEGMEHVAYNRNLQILGMRLNPAIDDWSFLSSLPLVRRLLSILLETKTPPSVFSLCYFRPADYGSRPVAQLSGG